MGKSFKKKPYVPTVMKCPVCKEEMQTKEITVHGITVPIFGCDICKGKYVLKKQLDKKVHEVQKQMAAWMKERKVKTL